ncbi:YceI family protein [Leucobacter denitrificans]|uniref:YceI family protein n=1 Tax=Leucobacter denitrificans TaxID=683042 RepID=UPI003612704E
MKRTQKVLIASGVGVIVLGVLVALAGPPIYRDFIAPPAAEAPTLMGDPSLTGESEVPALDGPLEPADIAGAWSISEGSVAGYRVNEVLRGTDVTVTGRTSEVTGSLEISDDGLTLETAEFTVDVASIATDQSQRDSYFRDSAIRVSENPEAGFVLTSPVTVDALPEAGEIVELEITGDLSIAGETNAVTTVVQVRSDGSTTELAGSIPITFADYGVEAPSLGFVKVEDNGFVEFQLVAMKG